MDLFKLSNSALSKQHQDLVEEIARRTKVATADAATVIRGQECGKRAVLVAAEGKHSLLLVGEPAVGKTMLRAMAAELGLLRTFEAWPCPCGYFSSPGRECSCTNKQVGKHRRNWPVADISIEIPPVPNRDLRGALRGTSVDDMRKQLVDAFVAADCSLNRDCENLLRAASSEIPLDARQQETVIRVARTIANLDRSSTIEARHLCEAINYQLRGYR